MEPENDGLEDDFPFQLDDLGFHVNLPGCNPQPKAIYVRIIYIYIWYISGIYCQVVDSI